MPESRLMNVSPLIRSLLLAGALMLGHQSASAEPVGSPASILKKGQWVFGLMGSRFTGRKLTSQSSASGYTFAHSRGYGLTDRISLYGKIGAGYFELDDRSLPLTEDSSTIHSFGTNVLAGVQVKARLWQHQPTGTEWDGSLQYAYLHRRNKTSNQPTWQEWQGATSVAKAWGRLKPYLGLKLSRVELDYRLRQNGQSVAQGSYTSRNTLGTFLGSDFYLGEFEDLVMNVETAFSGDGDEIAFTVSYTF